LQTWGIKVAVLRHPWKLHTVLGLEKEDVVYWGGLVSSDSQVVLKEAYFFCSLFIFSQVNNFKPHSHQMLCLCEWVGWFFDSFCMVSLQKKKIPPQSQPCRWDGGTNGVEQSECGMVAEADNISGGRTVMQSCTEQPSWEFTNHSEL